jgi:RHS repeat-associated protein
MAHVAAYDANGNRLTETGAAPQSNSFNPDTNQLRNVGNGSASLTYYPWRYIASGGGISTAFNQRGRLSSATTSAGTTNYCYNALGRLIYKNGASSPVGIMYDESGHIIGEYTNTGALIEETAWMGDIPVATIMPSGNSVAVYYIHTDQLGTPRKIANSANQLLWRWDPNTYGYSVPNNNPSGLGAFIYNLRFPGHNFQAETGFIYNFYRDYIPFTGTNLESDPMGLKGGSYSTYA